ncbi:hypothetical protein OQA88_9583 [Cercophora sp. LCS_1]
MEDVADPTSWYRWFTQLSIIAPEYHYILRMISWFFITLALIPIVPIMGLVIYDLTLWLCRLVGASYTESRQRETDAKRVSAHRNTSTSDEPSRKGVEKGGT